jgi:Cys-tRNA(Pro)/Cys-tRNA(Cys) deacylase
MTPAVLAARRAGIRHRLHEYAHDPATPAYGMEAAEKMGVNPERVFKTLVIALEPARLAVALVPVAGALDLKAVAAALGAKRAVMAPVADAERTTGYVVGGISPLGQRKRLPMVVDSSALQWEEIYVSAGRRGLEIALAPSDLLRLTGAATVAIAREE